jgi:hypothetical protein
MFYTTLDRLIRGEYIFMDGDKPGEKIVMQALDPKNPTFPSEMLAPHEKRGEPGVVSYGFTLSPEDYEYRTHVVRPGLRRHVKEGNAMIISTIVLNHRPDLAEATSPLGESLDDLINEQVTFLHKKSKQFTAQHTRSFVFAAAADMVIKILAGEVP